MWSSFAKFLLSYKHYVLSGLILLTIFFGFQARKAELSYDFTSAVPNDDADFVFFKEFKSQFGDDGTVLGLGIQDKSIYQLKNFTLLNEFIAQLKKEEGVTQALGVPQLQYLEKDTINKKFLSKSLFSPFPTSQKSLDSLLILAHQQKFYENLLFNPKNDAMIVLVTIDRKVLDSQKRQKLLQNIVVHSNLFTEKTQIKVRFGGLPYIRSVVTKQVSAELIRLLAFSGLATVIILGVFFGSFTALFIPIIIIGMVVVWSIGFIGLLGFKMNLLTGLLPPILVVIGVPNCVYLLNKYHQEFRHFGEKNKALSYVLQNIGMVTFLTNMTTAIGFGVFVFTPNQMIREFGVISFLSVLSTFVISVLLLPILYSYLPSPTTRQLRHLDRTPLQKMLVWLDFVVFQRRKWVFGIVTIIILVSLGGIFQIKPLSFMLDNVPHNSQPKKDLHFFEENFKGIMPLEIVIDTKQKQGIMQLNTLKKVEKLQNILAKLDYVGRPLSIVNFIQMGKQAFYNQDTASYSLPTQNERPFILQYLSGGQKNNQASTLLRTMVDSTGQKMRISLKIADIGSQKLDELIHKIIEPEIEKIFPKNGKIQARVTGTTLIFIKGNLYLIQSLQSSLMLAIILIGLIMATLFRSWQMILISVFTNLLPLLITAGIMGYWGIPLKPSSALIFSIAFGIAVDDSIHFLARYKQELVKYDYDTFQAVKVALRETGAGMFYTSIILFFGFIVFLYSDFEGTIVLGGLTSTTLLCAMVGNLILLPSLLLTFPAKKKFKV